MDGEGLRVAAAEEEETEESAKGLECRDLVRPDLRESKGEGIPGVEEWRWDWEDDGEKRTATIPRL